MLGPDLYMLALAYVKGDSTLRALEEWVVPRLPFLFAQPPAFERELAATIELGLAELSESVVDEAGFRQRLAWVLESTTPTFCVPGQPTSPGQPHIENTQSGETEQWSTSPALAFAAPQFQFTLLKLAAAS